MHYGNPRLISTKRKARILTGLLASTLMLQASCVGFAAEEINSSTEASDILSQDNLPNLPPKAETAWLHSINNEVSDAEPVNVQSDIKEASESGAIAAIMPAPMATQIPNGAPQAVNGSVNITAGAKDSVNIAAGGNDSLSVAAGGDVFSNGRISSDPSAAPSAIEELTRQILLKEIALEKFNLNYKLNAAKQGRWKGERYAFLSEVNGSLGLTGGIISMWNRSIHIHDSSEVKTYVQEDANIFPEIGAIIGASAAFIELAINEYHEYQAATKGFSPAKAREHINSLKSDINRMLSERDELVKVEQSAPLLTGRVEVDSLEGKVLTDLRDQSLLEYQRFHLNARRTMAFQQTQYLFDFSKNVTNAIGYNFAYLALHRHRRPWNNKAGILFDVSGGLFMAGPIVSRLAAKAASEYHKHYMHDTIKDAEAQQVALLERDQKDLDSVIKSGKYSTDVTGKVVDRAALYGDHSKTFQDEVAASTREVNKSKLIAGENIGAGIFIGGTKLASGILFNACGWPQLYNKGKADIQSTRVTNQLLFAASVVGTAGVSFGMLDTLRIQVQGEVNRHKLAGKGELPSQLVHKRLTQLDTMEAKLNAAHP